VDISGATPPPDSQGPIPATMSAGPDDGPDAGPRGASTPAGTAVGESVATGARIGDGAVTGAGPSHLFRYLAVYSVLRLLLVAALTAVLAFFMPLIVALLFAIIVQLPLAWLLFAGPRRRVNDAMAKASAHRRAERARLQSALTGEVDPG
jgi:hypothetical protein